MCCHVFGCLGVGGGVLGAVALFVERTITCVGIGRKSDNKRPEDIDVFCMYDVCHADGTAERRSHFCSNEMCLLCLALQRRK